RVDLGGSVGWNATVVSRKLGDASRLSPGTAPPVVAFCQEKPNDSPRRVGRCDCRVGQPSQRLRAWEDPGSRRTNTAQREDLHRYSEPVEVPAGPGEGRAGFAEDPRADPATERGQLPRAGAGR